MASLEITKSFLLQIYRTEASAPRKKQFVDPVAATGASAGLILGDPIKDAACTALAIFNMCSDNNQISRDVKVVMHTQQQTILTLHRVQARNFENFFILGNEVRATQSNLKEIRDQVNEPLKRIDKEIRTIKCSIVEHKECQRLETVHLRFLQEIRNFISDMGTLYTHLNSIKQPFMLTRLTCSPTSHLASGHITPLLPQEIADNVQELSDEVSRGTKLWPAIQLGFEAIYYEINIVLEVTLIPQDISVVLGVPMNSKSSTFDVYPVIPRHQTNEDNISVPASKALLSGFNGQFSFCRAG